MKPYKQLLAAQLLATLQATSTVSPFRPPKRKRSKVYPEYNTSQEQARRLRQSTKKLNIQGEHGVNTSTK